MRLRSRRLWIKAAVEHRRVRLSYREGGPDSDVSWHLVEPDFEGRARGRLRLPTGPRGLWAARDLTAGVGPRMFDPARVVSMELTDERFEPGPDSRWVEHLEEYHELDLRDEGD